MICCGIVFFRMNKIMETCAMVRSHECVRYLVELIPFPFRDDHQ